MVSCSSNVGVHQYLIFPYCQILRFFPFFTTLDNTIMRTIVHKSVFEFLTIIRREVAGSKYKEFLKAPDTTCNIAF